MALGSQIAHGYWRLPSATSSIMLPWTVAADSAHSRVESVATGIALCINVPGAASQLNRMQAEWARHLLGIAGCRQGAWPFLVSEVGWQMRLGTRMI